MNCWKASGFQPFDSRAPTSRNSGNPRMSIGSDSGLPCNGYLLCVERPSCDAGMFSARMEGALHPDPPSRLSTRVLFVAIRTNLLLVMEQFLKEQEKLIH